MIRQDQKGGIYRGALVLSMLVVSALVINLPVWLLDGLSTESSWEPPASPERVTTTLYSSQSRGSSRVRKENHRKYREDQSRMGTDDLTKGTVIHHLPLLVGSDNQVSKDALRRLDDLMPDKDGSIPKRLMKKRLNVFQTYLQNSQALNMSWKAALENSLQRGIVITAGGPKALLNAFSVIYILRNKLKCNLPIIMAFWGDLDMSPGTRAYYRSLIPRLDFLDITTHPRDWPGHHIFLDNWETSRQYQGYKLKIWSIYLAPFRQVLYLDADNTPITDPSELFDIEPFKKHGSLFWPDYWQDPVDLYGALSVSPNPWVQTGVISEPQDPTLLKLSFESEDKAPKVQTPPNYLWPFQAESGQLVIDKERHWDVLEYLLFLNTHDTFTYANAMGDKDTFRVAFSMAGKAEDYWQCPFAPSIPLLDTHREDIRYCCLGMLQIHPITGNPLFHHRTAEAKLELKRNRRKCVGPITHVTPSITRPQAGVMMWGNVEANLYGGPNTRYQWGLRSDQVYEFACETHKAEKNSFGSETAVRQYHHKYGDEWCACRPENLHLADLQCANRTLKEQYYNALPISIIQVPKVAPTYRISEAEEEVLSLIPFLEE